MQLSGWTIRNHENQTLLFIRVNSVLRSLWPLWLAIGGHYVLLLKVFLFFFSSAGVTKLPGSPAVKRGIPQNAILREEPCAWHLHRSTLIKVKVKVGHLYIGTTVFRGKRNFAPSRGICALPRKTYIAAEFRGIGYFLEKTCFTWFWFVFLTYFSHLFYLLEVNATQALTNWMMTDDWYHAALPLIYIYIQFFVRVNEIRIVNACMLDLKQVIPQPIVELLLRPRIFAAVSRGIYQSTPRNFSFFAAENSGP